MKDKAQAEMKLIDQQLIAVSAVFPFMHVTTGMVVSPSPCNSTGDRFHCVCIISDER